MGFFYLHYMASRNPLPVFTWRRFTHALILGRPDYLVIMKQQKELGDVDTT
jgi:hypothetical protein